MRAGARMSVPGKPSWPALWHGLRPSSGGEDAGGSERLGLAVILDWGSPRLLVLRSDRLPEHGMPEPVITRVELYDLGGRTGMELIDGRYPKGFAHAETGWRSSFDRLAASLAAG